MSVSEEAGTAAAARETARALVMAAREAVRGTWRVDGIDVGPAVEQQLFFALRDGTFPVHRGYGRRHRVLPAAAALAALAGGMRRRPWAAGPREILVVVRQEVHLRLLEPVTAALAALGRPAPAVVRLGRAGADSTLEAWGPALAGLLRPADAGRLLTVGVPPPDRLADAWSALVGNDRARSLAALAARTRIEAGLGAVGLSSAVRQVRPRVLATYDEVGSWGRLVAAVAARHGLVSVDLPHAEAVDAIAIAGGGFDAWAVFGPRSAATLRVAGIPAERIVTVGAARFDALVRDPSVPQPAGPRTILFASQYIGGPVVTRTVKERTLALALGAAAAAAPARLIVVPHPAESDDVTRQLLRSASPRPGLEVGVASDRTLHDLLPGAWLLLTGSSQSVLDATAAGVPSVTLNATGGADPVPYAAEGLALGAADEAAAAAAIGSLLDGEARERQLARARAALEAHIGPLDGRAAERTARLLAGLAADPPTMPGEGGLLPAGTSQKDGT